jgi:integrase/recombinase XerD
MALIRIVTRKEERPDGTLPLALRINKHGKVSYIYLEYTVKKSDWDKKAQRVKKSHPSHARLNNYLIKKLSEATDKTLELETNKSSVTIKAVRNKIKPMTGDTFFNQSEEYLQALQKAGKYNEYTANKPRLQHFKEYLKGEDISFSDVTVGCLEHYTNWLRSRVTVAKNGAKKTLGERSIMNHLSAIRSVFAFAKRHEVIDGSHTPFGRGKTVIRFPDSKKVGLNQEDVSNIEQVDLTNPRHNHARNIWLFSFYFAGMRVSDVLRVRWSDFDDGRFYYKMGKNDKGDSLKVPEKIWPILKQYEEEKQSRDDLVFPELKDNDFSNQFITERTIAFKTSALDKVLRNNVAPAAGIEKKLTMHITRHTFGKLAGNSIKMKTLQKLYRHHDLATTAMYQQNFDHDEVDDALDKVINNKMQPS